MRKSTGLLTSYNYLQKIVNFHDHRSALTVTKAEASLWGLIFEASKITTVCDFFNFASLWGLFFEASKITAVCDFFNFASLWGLFFEGSKITAVCDLRLLHETTIVAH